MTIVIVGAGFGGLRTAIRLSKKLPLGQGDELILIDRTSYHIYTPAIYEVATAYRGAELSLETPEHDFASRLSGSVCFSIRDVLSGRGVTFVQDEVVEVDTVTNSITTKRGDTIFFDYAVLAPGAVVNHFGVEGAALYCQALKTIPDALRIRGEVEAAFKRARWTNDILHFAVVGAGLSGFEVATELAFFGRHLLRDYHIAPHRLRISLIEAGPDILSGMPGGMHKAATRRLHRLGITVCTNTRVVKTEEKALFFESGERQRADVMVWSGGIAASPLFETLGGVALQKGGRVPVDEHLRVRGFSNIFAIGDSISYRDAKRDIYAPATAWAAEQQADAVVAYLIAHRKGKEPEPYQLRFPGFVASAGGKYGIASLYGMTISGFFGWVIKRIIDLKYITSLHSPITATRMWVNAVLMFGRND